MQNGTEGKNGESEKEAIPAEPVADASETAGAESRGNDAARSHPALSGESKIFCPGDGVAGAGCALAAFVLYWWTAAPSVTLLDSGEFVLAAQHFGVPHPTGYPLWTLLAWLFCLLPIGNPAWQVALFSGVAGAVAVGLCALLLASALRWIFPGMRRRGIFVMSCGWTLLFALSESQWSQAVIAEVYTLHASIVAAFLLSLYIWVRQPERDAGLFAAVFFFALGMSNHHLMLVLAPLPAIAVLLLRRDILPDFFMAALLTACLGYLLFAQLSGEFVNLKTALRFAWLVLTGFVLFCVHRRFRLHWEFVAYLPVLVAAGLLPYAYMPFASSTNPPMNWGYTREKAGFFYSINRSQYGGSLDGQLLRTVGRLVGTRGLAAGDNREVAEPLERPAWEPGRIEQMQRWSGFFWQQLFRNFGLLALPSFFAALLLIRRCELPKRTWLYLLFIGFFLAAFLQPIFDGAEIDRAGWWLQMPYHTYTMLFFALAASLGTGVLVEWAAKKRRWLATGLLALLLASPAWAFWQNWDVCSQRNRWFGWKFGHEILHDLPKHAFVFGGTDPGRFVPSYLILGESTAEPARKIDPAFDRRDLFIVTQNAMTDLFYWKYIRDQYTEGRPPARNAFERWLGRETQYPEDFLCLPSEEEVNEIISAELKKGTDATEINSVVAKVVWERNRDRYAFFVEESFPMKWSYDHAVPRGLIHEIRREPLSEIPAEAVEADMRYWDQLLEEFRANPRFHGDYDARRTFSSLRQSIANLYLHRKMHKQAEVAMLQALDLLPANISSLLLLSRQYWDAERFEEAAELWRRAAQYDPNNPRIEFFLAVAESRPEWQKEISALRGKLAENPKDAETRRELLAVLLHLGEDEKADSEIAEARKQLADNPEFLRHLVGVQMRRGKTDSAREIARELLTAKPDDSEIRLFLAAIALQREETEEFYRMAQEAVEFGGAKARDLLQSDPAFRTVRQEEKFRALIESARTPSR